MEFIDERRYFMRLIGGRAGRDDVVVGVIVISLALFGLFVAIPAGIDAPKSVPFLALAPAFWPNIILCLLALLGLVVLLGGLSANKRNSNETTATPTLPSTAEPDVVANDATEPQKSQWLHGVAAIILLFVYYVGLHAIGFIAASMLAIVAYMLLGGIRNVVTIALVALLLPTGLYFFFTIVARVAVPLGVLEGIFS